MNVHVSLHPFDETDFALSCGCASCDWVTLDCAACLSECDHGVLRWMMNPARC